LIRTFTEAGVHTKGNTLISGEKSWSIDRERALVLRATKQDQLAFAQLYDRYVSKIYKYIYYRVGGWTEAEDLTAQVFLKAWEAITHYRWTERPFAAWLYRIAHNLVVDYFRAHQETVPLDEIFFVEEPNMRPDEIVQQHLSSEMFRRMLRRLTVDQQQVILLRFVEGYNTAETAHIMGKTEGAVRTLQHRALATCGRLLSASAETLEAIRE
jgi:RNA polymerase sigma-70 factor, ECF subfamily